MALWKVALETVTVEIAGRGGIAVEVLQVVQHLRHHSPCPGGEEQAAWGLG